MIKKYLFLTSTLTSLLQVTDHHKMVEGVFISRHQRIFVGLFPRYIGHFTLVNLQSSDDLILRLLDSLVSFVELTLSKSTLLDCSHDLFCFGEEVKFLGKWLEIGVEVTS
jgi:hypothetical protein